MTIDNLQQPSGESLRKRAMRLAPEAEEIILPLYTEDIKPSQFLATVLEAFGKTDALTQRIIERQKQWNSVFVSPCDAELVRGQFHHSWDWWPWGGTATTEDYR